MNKETRRQEFLDKAKDADERAAKAKGPQLRDSWQKIAQTYRDLAKTT